MTPPEHVDFFLASGSPRRRELLAGLGYRFSVLGVSVPEEPLPGEPAGDYVERVARAKARAGLAARGGPALPVLGADTEVLLDDRVLGKPASEYDLLSMLGSLSGRTHRVLSVVVVGDGTRELCARVATEVTMRPIAEAEIRAYWRSGEPRDKAGGYAVQGLAAAFVARIEGSYTGVVGLPAFETAALLAEFGILGWQRACAEPR